MALDWNIPGNGGTGAMSDTGIRVCRNILCLYAGVPDPVQYADCDVRCPRCGTPWNKRPVWKGPDRDGEDPADTLNALAEDL